MNPTESFCGVGNPLGLGEVRPGQTVLDVGSGPGMDSLLAARKMRPSGKVIGVDLGLVDLLPKDRFDQVCCLTI
jgi:23S rRNA U2552 (ribose-2'-O)-methylase RlmE/FtsJ